MTADGFNFFLRPWDILRMVCISVCLPVKYTEYRSQQSHGLDFCPIRAKYRLGFSADSADDLLIGSQCSQLQGCTDAGLVEGELVTLVFTSKVLSGAVIWLDGIANYVKHDLEERW